MFCRFVALLIAVVVLFAFVILPLGSDNVAAQGQPKMTPA